MYEIDSTCIQEPQEGYVFCEVTRDNESLISGPKDRTVNSQRSEIGDGQEIGVENGEVVEICQTS